MNSSVSEKLKPFVFIDGRSNPYKVAPWGGGVWLFYWNHGCKSWVSQREIKDEEELDSMMELALPEEEAALYEKQQAQQS